MPTRYTSSADTHAMVARIAPIILGLLGDSIPRSRRDFVAALTDRYPKEEVELTLMRLAVTGQILTRKIHHGIFAKRCISPLSRTQGCALSQ